METSASFEARSAPLPYPTATESIDERVEFERLSMSWTDFTLAARFLV
jgi:hypothetical protein